MDSAGHTHTVDTVGVSDLLNHLGDSWDGDGEPSVSLTWSCGLLEFDLLNRLGSHVVLLLM